MTKKNQIFWIFILFFYSLNAYAYELKHSSNSKNWSVFIPNGKKNCFLASKAITGLIENKSISNLYSILLYKKYGETKNEFEFSIKFGTPIKNKPILFEVDQNQFYFFSTDKFAPQGFAWSKSINDLEIESVFIKGGTVKVEAEDTNNNRLQLQFSLTGYEVAAKRLEKKCFGLNQGIKKKKKEINKIKNKMDKNKDLILLSSINIVDLGRKKQSLWSNEFNEPS